VSATKFRHGDRITLDLDAPVILRGREWVLLDLAPLMRKVNGAGPRRVYGTMTRVAPWAKGRAWWLQDAETGEISTNFVAREGAMTRA
jgi:hypothetical protein